MRLIRWHKKTQQRYILMDIYTVIGIVLVWRGVWYVLDELDAYIFGSSHIWSALIGTLLGLFLLYIPDKDLKEIGKL